MEIKAKNIIITTKITQKSTITNHVVINRNLFWSCLIKQDIVYLKTYLHVIINVVKIQMLHLLIGLFRKLKISENFEWFYLQHGKNKKLSIDSRNKILQLRKTSYLNRKISFRVKPQNHKICKKTPINIRYSDRLVEW